MPFLSQLLGRPTLDADGTRVGILRDLLVSGDNPYPPISAIVVGDRGHLHAIPWLHVASVTPRGTALRSRVRLEAFPAPGDEMIWLGRDLLDKQIVDTQGVKLVRVNDLSLTPINGDLRLAGVDNSVAGLLRRLGIEWLARLAGRGRPRLIDWEQVDIGPAVDEIRLKVPFHRLRRMPPADIAAVISQMSPGEAADVLEALDDEIAADALAELTDEHQAAVVSAMEPEEAADVLEQMPPDDAADILGDVHEERAGELMRLMAPHTAEEVRSLLIYEDDTAGGLMNSRLFAVAEMETAGRVVEDLRRTAPPEDEIYYLYVVDSGGRLRGVLSLRDLVVAQPEALIADCMREDVAFVRLEDSKEEVARKLIHYNLLAIPVVDEHGHLKGMVTVDDVLDLVTPRAWQNRPRRMTG
jgi:CBS domain-containing protein/sporulation protein YlmC with PRC-barrel domain